MMHDAPGVNSHDVGGNRKSADEERVPLLQSLRHEDATHTPKTLDVKKIVEQTVGYFVGVVTSLNHASRLARAWASLDSTSGELPRALRSSRRRWTSLTSSSCSAM